MAAVDLYSNFETALDSCYPNAAAVTPSDSTDLGYVTRALYVGGTGDIVATVAGSDVTFKSVPTGTVLAVRTSRVKSTGTTAPNLIALW
jgi:hypothetical protein